MGLGHNNLLDEAPNELGQSPFTRAFHKNTVFGKPRCAKLILGIGQQTLMSENVSHLCLLPFQLSPPHHSHLTIKRAPKNPKHSIWGAYLSALNMVKFVIPEKILQNAVQMHWF